MSHEVFEQRFVAVREPAWHRLGRTYDEPIPPSQAVAEADLDLGAKTQPLYVQQSDGNFIDTGLVSVGRWHEGEWVSYGTASTFTVLPLSDVLAQLDEVAGQYPLSAAGTLSRGGEVFFTFSAGESEIAGEEYQEYLVFRHSYTPGVAQLVMWTPVRVVCRNTLIVGEGSATTAFRLAHTRAVGARTGAALVVAAALKQAEMVRERLEALARVQLSRDDVVELVQRTYAPYVPRVPDLSNVMDTVSASTIETLMRPAAAQQRYATRLVETCMAAYDRLCDTAPTIAGTAYAAYQAVVETADWRTGRDSAAESAVIGARATEKVRAWKLATALI